MKRAAIGMALALVLPGTAMGQAYQCRVPRAVEQPPPVRPDGPPVRTATGGYTLAISWSPEFCRGAAAADPGNLQCNGSIGRFGFVLHGLWPESAKGPPPQWCALTPRPTVQDLRANLCMTPLPWLLEHEWAKHGSCMAATPRAYFGTAAALWNRLHLPDADRLSRQDALTAGDLRRAMAAANPGLPPRAIGIVAGSGGWLRELHLCLGLTMRPRACAPRAFGPADAAPIRIWRGL